MRCGDSGDKKRPCVRRHDLVVARAGHHGEFAWLQGIGNSIWRYGAGFPLAVSLVGGGGGAGDGLELAADSSGVGGDWYFGGVRQCRGIG